jgi:hypothetical protein
LKHIIFRYGAVILIKRFLLLLFIFSFSNQAVSSNYSYSDEYSNYFLSPSYYPQDSEFKQVTQRYGPLIFDKSLFGKIVTFESNTKPWSSWWWPSYRGEIFDNGGAGLAPLEKMDLVLKRKFRVNSKAAQYEENNLFDSRAAGWSGLCDAWSIASISKPEPTKELVINKIKFNIEDQKALILKSYESSTSYSIFGQRNNAQWDSVYADIYPEELLRFIQYHLIEGKKPFIIDSDASPEVWTKPVYKVQLKMTPIILDEEEMLEVKMWLHMASHDVDKSFVGLKTIVKKYTFNLKVKSLRAQKVEVISGYWTDRSRWDHPDYVLLLNDTIEKKSLNQEFNLYIEKISNLLSF